MGTSCSKRKGTSIKETRGTVRKQPKIRDKTVVETHLQNGTGTKYKPQEDGPHQESKSKRGNFLSEREPTVQGSWDDILEEVSRTVPWGGVSRELRSPWRELVHKVEELARSPGQPLPEAKYRRIITGHATISDINTMKPSNSVRIYLSSVGEDTIAERTYLHADVFPFLRLMCERLGLDFQVVDLNLSGCRQPAERCHTTVLSLSEIVRCFSESIGPAFVCILGRTHGPVCLPHAIPKHEFELMHAYAITEHLEASLLTAFYRLDRNAIEQEYVLRNDDHISTREHWRTEVAVLQKMLKYAFDRCSTKENKLIERYGCSLLELEIKAAASQYSSIDRSVYIQRRIKDDIEVVLDSEGNNSNAFTKEKDSTLSKLFVETVEYAAANKEACIENIQELCDMVCRQSYEMIVDGVNARSLVQFDLLTQEIVEHAHHTRSYSRVLLGRDTEQKVIVDYLHQDTKSPLFLCGQDGSGKSTLIAFADRKVRDNKGKTVVVLRYIGLTVNSRCSYSLIRSLCKQITVAYGNDCSDIPHSDFEVLEYFKKALWFATETLPLLLIIDSIDTIQHDDLGEKLCSILITKSLPPHTKLIASLSENEIVNLMEQEERLPLLVRLTDLKPVEGHAALTSLIRISRRTLTDTQTALFDRSFSSCPLPLFLDLALISMQQWRSFDTISLSFPSDIPSLVNFIFDEIETACDKQFVHHTLAYITASRFGLMENELLTILHRDEALKETDRSVHERWSKLRWKIANLTSETMVFGQQVLMWRNKQIFNAAEKRYLREPSDGLFSSFTDKANIRIQNLFEERYAGSTDNQTTNHSLGKPGQFSVLDTPGQLMARTRVMLEYSNLLIKQRDWQRFKDIWADVECMKSIFITETESLVLNDLSEAARQSKDDDIVQLNRFLVSFLPVLRREPEMIYQLASQTAKTHYLRSLLRRLDRTAMPDIVTLEDPTLITIPYEMRYQGHAGGFQSCRFSASGDRIVASDDRGHLMVWEALTGQRLMSLTSLPLPSQEARSATNDRYLHTVNPCCFTGDSIAVASENGDIVLLDNEGTKMAVECTANGPATCLDVSPDTRLLVTGFYNGTVYLCEASTLTHVATVQTERAITGLSIAPDGQHTVVATEDKDCLFLIDMGSYTLTSNITLVTERAYTDLGTLGRTNTDLGQTKDGFNRTSGEEANNSTLDANGSFGTGHQHSVDGLDHVDSKPMNSQHVHDAAVGTQEPKSEKTTNATSTIKDIPEAVGAHVVLASTTSKGDSEDVTVDIRDITLCCTFHPNCTTILTGSGQGLITEWSVSPLRKTSSFTGHCASIWSIRFSRDGALMFSASSDRRINVWSHGGHHWTQVSSLIGHTNSVMSMDLHPVNQAELISASLDGTLLVWDITKRETTPPILEDGVDNLHDMKVYTRGFHSELFAYSPKSGLIARRSGQGHAVIVYPKEGGSGPATSLRHHGYITNVDFGSKGPFLVALSCSKMPLHGPDCVHVYDSGTGGVIHDLSTDVRHPTDVSCGNNVIAIGTNQGEVYLFDITTFTCRLTWCGVKPITLIACSTLDTLVLVASGREVTLLTIGETLKESWATIPRHESDITVAVFSPLDGAFVTGTSSGRISVWNYAGNKVTLRCVSRTDTVPVTSVQFSRTGTHIVMCSDDTLRIWRLGRTMQLTGSYVGSFHRAYFADEGTLIAWEMTGRHLTLKY